MEFLVNFAPYLCFPSFFLFHITLWQWQLTITTLLKYIALSCFYRPWVKFLADIKFDTSSMVFGGMSQNFAFLFSHLSSNKYGNFFHEYKEETSKLVQSVVLLKPQRLRLKNLYKHT